MGLFTHPKPLRSECIDVRVQATAHRQSFVSPIGVTCRHVSGFELKLPRAVPAGVEPLLQVSREAAYFASSVPHSVPIDPLDGSSVQLSHASFFVSAPGISEVQFLPLCTTSHYAGVPLNFLAQVTNSDEVDWASPISDHIPLDLATSTTWIDGRDLPPSVGSFAPCGFAPFDLPQTVSTTVVLRTPGHRFEAVAIPAPATRGRVFIRFAPTLLSETADNARAEASRARPPADDPFAAMFFLLLAKRNWDVRVHGLQALLAAYPEGKQPYPFQLEGINFLARRDAALLSDEMGLGKTIQAILAMRAKIHAGEIQRVLIVCPKSLLLTWYLEIATWAPELSARIVHGPDKHIAIKAPHHVYISNYEAVMRLVCGDDGRHLRSIKPYDLLVVDESQHLKNPSTRRARAITNISARQRWALTGTPLENAFADYRAIWRVIAPNSKIHAMKDAAFLKATKPDSLRREKKAVLDDLPDKVVGVQYVDLDGRQLKNYGRLEELAQHEAGAKRGSDARTFRTHIFALLTRLKQACIVDSATGESAKMDWLIERLDEMHPIGVPREDCEKALVFTQYPQLVCTDWKLPSLVERYRPLRYDGSMDDRERQQFIKIFQQDESRRLAFIGLQAGGTGLTLTRANQVVFLDQWWNPAVMEQAAARVHRIGQKRTCFVTMLIARNTVEERVMQILQRKKDLIDRVTGEIASGKRGEADIHGLSNALTLDDLLEALGLQKKLR